MTTTLYPYKKSPNNVYSLQRDGHLVMRGTEQQIWKYLHNTHSFSIDHALKHEGYKIEPEVAKEEANGKEP